MRETLGTGHGPLPRREALDAWNLADMAEHGPHTHRP